MDVSIWGTLRVDLELVKTFEEIVAGWGDIISTKREPEKVEKRTQKYKRERKKTKDQIRTVNDGWKEGGWGHQKKFRCEWRNKGIEGEYFHKHTTRER
jgi:hypothetical protein